MDEQQAQATELSQSQQTQESSLPEDTPNTTPAEEPEIGLNEAGELHFSDDVFKGYEHEQEKQEETTETEASQVNNLYSREELRNVPFEQWDRSRLPAGIAEYYDAVSEQIAARQKAEQIRNAPVPDIVGESPKPYTAKELLADSNKLAMKMLGIENEDDFDPDYDAEQRAAVDLARAQLIQQRNFQIATYQQRAIEARELVDFNARLASVPDYNEFSQWYINTLAKIGKTNEQVHNELYNIAQQYGGREVIRQVSNWYQRYKQETAQTPKTFTPPQPKQRRMAAPPRLEGTRGNFQAPNGGNYDMKVFSQMSPDEQAQALITMGLV